MNTLPNIEQQTSEAHQLEAENHYPVMPQIAQA
jgi:hypothetical protein